LFPVVCCLTAIVLWNMKWIVHWFCFLHMLMSVACTYNRHAEEVTFLSGCQNIWFWSMFYPHNSNMNCRWDGFLTVELLLADLHAKEKWQTVQRLWSLSLSPMLSAVRASLFALAGGGLCDNLLIFVFSMFLFAVCHYLDDLLQ